jgi:hypothetical protein
MLPPRELIDYLRNKRRPVMCTASLPQAGHVLVTCGACKVTIPVEDDYLTTTTANEIERALEPCLGPRWLP